MPLIHTPSEEPKAENLSNVLDVKSFDVLLKFIFEIKSMMKMIDSEIESLQTYVIEAKRLSKKEKEK